MTARRSRLVAFARIALAALPMAFLVCGCSSMRAGAAGVALSVVENHIAPTVLKQDDVDVACGVSVAALPLVGTLDHFQSDPAVIESVLLYMSSVCSDMQAIEHELRSMRAFRDKHGDESLDARIAQQRQLSISARRQRESFELMRAGLERRYPFSYGVTCPVFSREIDEFVYLIGSVAGVRAVYNDLASQSALGVSMDIPPLVDAAMKCLDNTKWWGAPQALRAVIWSIVPGGANGRDISAIFDQSMTLGEQSGVRLSHVIAALSAVSTDDQAALREVIRRFANKRMALSDTNYRVVDAIAELELQIQSDRIWTRLTGARTPVDALGRFPDDKTSPTVDVDNILR